MLNFKSNKKAKLYGLQQIFEDGRTGFYFILVPEVKEKYFLSLLKKKEAFELKDMGEIIESDYGVPSAALKEKLQATYEIEFLE